MGIGSDRRREINEKISKTLKERKICRKFTPEDIRKAHESVKRHNLEIIRFGDWNKLKQGQKKKRVLLEQDGKCNKCHLSDWFGRKLRLDFHHKDGDRKNEKRENVEYLCPNCHTSTENYGYRSGKDPNHSKTCIHKNGYPRKTDD